MKINPKISFTYFYIKYLSKIFLCLLGVLSLYGTWLIISEKLSTANSLSSIGSFIGGIFTLAAIIFAHREYLIYRLRNGSEKFRSFVVTQLRPLSSELFGMNKIVLSALFEKYRKPENFDFNLWVDEAENMSQVLYDFEHQLTDLSYFSKYLIAENNKEFSDISTCISEHLRALNAIIYCREITFPPKENLLEHAVIKDFLDLLEEAPSLFDMGSSRAHKRLSLGSSVLIRGYRAIQIIDKARLV